MHPRTQRLLPYWYGCSHSLVQVLHMKPIDPAKKNRDPARLKRSVAVDVRWEINATAIGFGVFEDAADASSSTASDFSFFSSCSHSTWSPAVLLDESSARSTSPSRAWSSGVNNVMITCYFYPVASVVGGYYGTVVYEGTEEQKYIT
jgi:hypothetical protein